MELPDRAKQQPAANQQHHCQRDFTRDQNVTDAPPSAPAITFTASVFQTFTCVGINRLKRRNQTKDQTRQQGDSERKKQRAVIDRHIGKPRQIRRRDRKQRFKSPNGHGPRDNST